MTRYLGARVAQIEPDQPDESTVDVARRILASISEDPLLRPSHRQAARQHLRKLQRQERREVASDIGADDTEEEDESDLD